MVELMSHFLCGEIEFKKWDEPIFSRHLFRAVEVGAQLDLYVQFDGNITQQIVFRILQSDPVRPNVSRLPFLIADSPRANTSDEIFYPASTQFTFDERLVHLETKIRDVTSWVQCIFDDPNAIEMTVVFSEGYDTYYRSTKCEVEAFPTIIRGILLPPDVVPSTRITVVRTT